MAATEFTPSGVVIDLDGTLLDDDEQCSPEARDAVRWAAQRVPVAIATGREPDEASHYARLLGLRLPQVCDNGARLVDPVTGWTLYDNPMPKETVQELIVSIAAMGLRFYAVDSGRAVRSFDDFKTWRVTVVVAHAVEEATAKAVAAKLGKDGVTVEFSTDASGDYWYVNFMHGGTDKAHGVREFTSRIGIDPRRLMAVGDSFNDLPMFRLAGLPVAMGHAPAEVKREAAYVTGDLAAAGAAMAIRRFVR